MRYVAIFLPITGLAFAQAHQPFQSQSPAGVVYGVNRDGQQTVEITDVAYEVTSTGVPGRPQNERLLLRTTTRTKEVVDEIGMEASTTVEAWPLGVDPKQKPLYTLKAAGIDSKTVDGALLVLLRKIRSGGQSISWGRGSVFSTPTCHCSAFRSAAISKPCVTWVSKIRRMTRPTRA